MGLGERENRALVDRVDPLDHRLVHPGLDRLHFWVQGSGCRVQGSEFRVQDSEFRVQSSGFSGFKVWTDCFAVCGVRGCGGWSLINKLCSRFRAQSLGFGVQLGFNQYSSQFWSQGIESANYVFPSREWFRGSGFSYWVSGFGFLVSGFGFRVSGFGFRVSCVGFRVSGVLFRVSVFGFLALGFGFRVCCFGFRFSGFGFRDSLLGDLRLEESVEFVDRERPAVVPVVLELLFGGQDLGVWVERESLAAPGAFAGTSLRRDVPAVR